MGSIDETADLTGEHVLDAHQTSVSAVFSIFLQTPQRG